MANHYEIMTSIIYDRNKRMMSINMKVKKKKKVLKNYK